MHKLKSPSVGLKLPADDLQCHSDTAMFPHIASCVVSYTYSVSLWMSVSPHIYHLCFTLVITKAKTPAY